MVTGGRNSNATPAQSPNVGSHYSEPLKLTMPFTFSHPAIVLPLTKYTGRHLSLTGLIIGSLTPDFEYFFRMKVESNFSHSIWGLFYFNLPVGLLLAFLFHNIIRNTLYDNLPLAFRNRLETFKTFNWNNYFRQSYFAVIVSILFGATSHLLWDSFTHIHGYSVEAISVLRQSLKVGGQSIPFYKLLQHFSSIIGGLFIAFAFYNLPTHQVTKQKISVQYWIVILSIIILVVFVRLAFKMEKNLLGELIVTTISAILIALTIAPSLTRNKI